MVIILYTIIVIYVFFINSKLRNRERILSRRKSLKKTKYFLNIFEKISFCEYFEFFFEDFFCSFFRKKTDVERVLMRNEVNSYVKLSLFPCVFVLAWIIPSINRIFGFLTGRNSFIISFIHLVLISSDGTLNLIFFFIDPINQINFCIKFCYYFCCCSCCCLKFFKKKKEDESINELGVHLNSDIFFEWNEEISEFTESINNKLDVQEKLILFFL